MEAKKIEIDCAGNVQEIYKSGNWINDMRLRLLT